ncbi:recombining binding protein suppressor of hairless-like protein [Thunnus albacares]|uniref:recombining binding protein suppressor of hairless-like protein n=1 Tax=Thunnus albacares TaxID=8236 RepID=UPI001C4B46D2|nr:recombining binding protein suppressor of hairless-like protein isoform X1 [Thunnus maccoyii]XP_042260843.1 recombining binding protein suppressor of hairless-like protein isoform X1 [Thunnus maccoyii]XP_044205311.1 recombining binding protein suppressor of hairless-like protein [Thunnus albacares]XP_044205312.1 recombining binding protein suppressor of hairless-like protein [Thunnus albacares]XP_044205313.1 recombining binding protein suppressor of hairless-like protein [Thunnus albacares]
MEEMDVVEDGRKDTSMHQPGYPQADPALLYPPPLSPEPVSPLTHLGKLLVGHDVPRTGGWDRRLDPGFQLLGTREPGIEAHADQSVIILHAKVAQKSYGNEKRFFCPPPCVYISGHGWRVMQDHLKAAGYGDSVYRVCGYMCLDSSSQSQADTFKLVFDEQPNSRQMFACAKSLFISDQDKRKHFRLLLQLSLGNRQEVGSFQSRMIKVISKPSQKRQSMKNADLCISSCSRVALFNRLRSQTVSTRYLSVDRGAFIASARQWTAFTITLVEDQRADQGDFVLSEGFICYGCVVQLVCTESGVALPPMVIRKVNKQHAILDVDEPVSQLHKCAFQFRDNPHAYMCLSNDTIIQHQATSSVRDPSRVVLNDGSCWTIIGVEAVEFTFNQSLACIQTPVSPFPVITGLEVNGGGHVAMLEIHGENFNPHLKVWFGNSEAETMFKSPKSLLCVVPDVAVFSDGWRRLRRIITVPLSLLRLDGLIYRTPFTFTYTPEFQRPPPVRGGGGGAAGGGGKREGGMEGDQEEDVLLETIHQEFTRANFHLFMQS